MWTTEVPTTVAPTTAPPVELEFEVEIVTEVSFHGDILW